MKAKKLLSLLLVVAMLMSVLCMSVSAEDYDPVSIGEGEPVTINWNGTSGTVVSVDGTSYIPRQFILWAQTDYTVSVGTDELTPDREPGAGDTAAQYRVYTDATSAITITATNGTTTYTITCPHYTAMASGTNPVAVNGYLPVGQFARPNSFGWGTLYSDSTNVKSSSNTAKFLNGYESVGVSLGMAGGYVQFDMGDNRIINDPNNKYGIDFIIYGNAFVGNPEAAGVQVSNDGINWYTLAGSRHYMDGTVWNQNISYIKIAAANTTIGAQTFAKAGVYCSTNFVVPASDNASDVNVAIGAATWTGIPQLTGTPKTLNTATPAAASWWPEYADSENYGNVWNIGNAMTDVSWLRSGAAEVITYEGVTTVEDDMVVYKDSSSGPSQAQMSDVYQWGYADVRVNGSQYGTVVNNPYADAPSTDAGAGGDGFDLSWAVKADGTPISISSARYVRVYSAVLFNAGIFGETSSEVCGLYVANSTGSSTITNDLTIINSNEEEVATTNMGYQEIDAGEYILASSADNVKVNGITATGAGSDEGYSFDIAVGEFVQIITQTGTESPYITVFRGK